jgi:hypothetical protein
MVIEKNKARDLPLDAHLVAVERGKSIAVDADLTVYEVHEITQNWQFRCGFRKRGRVNAALLSAG